MQMNSRERFMVAAFLTALAVFSGPRTSHADAYPRAVPVPVSSNGSGATYASAPLLKSGETAHNPEKPSATVQLVDSKEVEKGVTSKVIALEEMKFSQVPANSAGVVESSLFVL